MINDGGKLCDFLSINVKYEYTAAWLSETNDYGNIQKLWIWKVFVPYEHIVCIIGA